MLGGNFTALVTPFLKNKNIDYAKLKELTIRQIKMGTTGIVALGSTAEASTLDEYEKHKIMETIVSSSNKKAIIIAGINAFSLDDALSQSLQRFIDGADALLIPPPPYIKPSKKGLLDFYQTLADQSYIPIILYNIPSRTGINIPTDLIQTLSLHPNIVGIKEASGDINYALSVSKYVNNSFSLLSGNDNLLLPLLSLGASGIISVIGNISPTICEQTIKNFQSSNPSKAKDYYHSHLNLIDALSFESNPICIKYIMSKLNLIKPYYRKPLCEPDKTTKKKINAVLKNCNFFEEIQ